LGGKKELWPKAGGGERRRSKEGREKGSDFHINRAERRRKGGERSSNTSRVKGREEKKGGADIVRLLGKRAWRRSYGKGKAKKKGKRSAADSLQFVGELKEEREKKKPVTAGKKKRGTSFNLKLGGGGGKGISQKAGSDEFALVVSFRERKKKGG